MKCFILLVFFIGIVESMSFQSIAVKGKLMCDGTKPANRVQVKLWEYHTGPDPDRRLDQGYTDENGEFNLKGGIEELSEVDFILKVYNACGGKPGLQNIRFKLPKSYITRGMFPKKTFDTGIINLETILAGKEREILLV